MIYGIIMIERDLKERNEMRAKTAPRRNFHKRVVLFLTTFKYIYRDEPERESGKFIKEVMGHSTSTHKANYMRYMEPG